MYGKTVVSIFFAVIIAIFIYYYSKNRIKGINMGKYSLVIVIFVFAFVLPVAVQAPVYDVFHDKATMLEAL